MAVNEPSVYVKWCRSCENEVIQLHEHVCPLGNLEYIFLFFLDFFSFSSSFFFATFIVVVIVDVVDAILRLLNICSMCAEESIVWFDHLIQCVSADEFASN